MKNFNLLITSMPQKQPTGPQIKMATLLNPKKHLMRKQYLFSQMQTLSIKRNRGYTPEIIFCGLHKADSKTEQVCYKT